MGSYMQEGDILVRPSFPCLAVLCPNFRTNFHMGKREGTTALPTSKNEAIVKSRIGLKHSKILFQKYKLIIASCKGPDGFYMLLNSGTYNATDQPFFQMLHLHTFSETQNQ